MRLRLLAAATTAAFTLVPGTAHAIATPAPWDCTVQSIVGARVTGYPAAVTAQVHSVTAVVTCELTGLLTHPIVDWTPLYKGGMSLGVVSSETGVQNCVGGTLTEVPSVGPTLVLAGTGICVWPADDDATYWPIAFWSTMNLDGSNGRVASNENMGPDSFKAAFVN